MSFQEIVQKKQEAIQVVKRLQFNPTTEKKVLNKETRHT